MFETHSHKNRKRIRYTTSLRTESTQMDVQKNINVHYSLGLKCFGIPLKITDGIGIERVETFGELRCGDQMGEQG